MLIFLFGNEIAYIGAQYEPRLKIILDKRIIKE